MIISVVNQKGGVAKTTTAVHFAVYLATLGSTVLVDGDPNRSAVAWAGRSNHAFSFTVITEIQLTRHAGKFQHIITDTKARPEPDDLKDLISSADLIILPTPPSGDDLRVTANTAKTLTSLGSENHRILLTRVPTHRNSTDERDARNFLAACQAPVLKGKIRNYKAYEKAFVSGVPVSKVKDRNAKIAWCDYESVVREALRG
jgi:chromosome partitioning protein